VIFSKENNMLQQWITSCFLKNMIFLSLPQKIFHLWRILLVICFQVSQRRSSIELFLNQILTTTEKIRKCFFQLKEKRFNFRRLFVLIMKWCLLMIDQIYWSFKLGFQYNKYQFYNNFTISSHICEKEKQDDIST
jgi:hypothetical protein